MTSDSGCSFDLSVHRYRNAYFPDKPIEFPPILPIPGDISRKTGSSILWSGVSEVSIGFRTDPLGNCTQALQ